MTTITRAMLSPMMEAAISRLHVGERAVKAAELVLSGKVQKTNGVWLVQGEASQPYEVSISNGYCTCPDAKHGAPRDHRNRPLCKHMLAAMYLVKLGATRTPTAGELLASLIAQADGQTIRLYVRSGYTGHQGTLQNDAWTAYRLPGGEKITLAEPLDVSLAPSDFWTEMNRLGWQRARYNRSHAGQTVWELEPEPVPVPDWPKAQPAAGPWPGSGITWNDLRIKPSGTKPQPATVNDNPFD
jgi:predicted nucleic acid-binding Zn finger protein